MRRSTPVTAAGVFESTPRELATSVLSMGFGGCELSPVLGDGFAPSATGAGPSLAQRMMTTHPAPSSLGAPSLIHVPVPVRAAVPEAR